MAQSQNHPPQSPQIKTEQQTDSAAKSEAQSNEQAKPAEKQSPVKQQISSHNPERQTDENAEKRADEAGEYWPFRIFGARLKITDSLLALFTFFLILVGIGQGIFLYRTDQGTQKAAEAAQKAAKVAEDTLTITQRAFVFMQKFNVGFIYENGRVHHLVFNPTWENSGATPAQSAKTWTGFVFTEMNQTIDDINIDLPAKVPVAPSTVGPKIVAPGTKVNVPIGDAMTTWRKERRLFLWALIEYEDIFSERRHTQVSAEVILTENPSTVTPTSYSDNTLDFIVVGTRYNTFR